MFFFQAEDGIRDYKVTGVQTCALPIFLSDLPPRLDPQPCTIAIGVLNHAKDRVRLDLRVRPRGHATASRNNAASWAANLSASKRSRTVACAPHERRPARSASHLRRSTAS